MKYAFVILILTFCFNNVKCQWSIYYINELVQKEIPDEMDYLIKNNVHEQRGYKYFIPYPHEHPDSVIKSLSFIRTLDKSGNLISEFYYNSDVIYLFFCYKYDNQGRLISEKKFEKDSLHLVSEQRYSYTNDGRLSEKKVYEPEISKITKSNYDTDGFLVSEEKEFEYILKDYHKYIYNEKGQLINCEKYFGNSKLLTKFKFDLNESGLIIQETQFYRSDTVEYLNVKISYNSANKIDSVFTSNSYMKLKYNASGQVTNIISKFSYEYRESEDKFIYNESGMMIEKKLDYYYEKMEYNDKNLIIRKEYTSGYEGSLENIMYEYKYW